MPLVNPYISMIIKNVLIIDDDDLSIFLMGLAIDEMDFIEKYESVHSGWEALKFFENCKRSVAPEIILVDLNMPEMDGYEFIQHFEEKFAKNFPGTKLIVVTSSQRESDKVRSLAFDSVIGFINKPLEEKEIKKILEIT